MEKDARTQHVSGYLLKLAKDRQKWKSYVAALCTSRHEEDKSVREKSYGQKYLLSTNTIRFEEIITIFRYIIQIENTIDIP